MNKTTVKYPFLPEEVEIYERDNGHKVVLAHKDGGLVNISTWVRTGSINETEENNGISHFLEHLMFKGTHKHPAGEFDKILEAKGAIVNAATWKDYTFYYVTLPKGENDEDFNLALELHADMMTDPVLPEDEIGAPFDINDKNIGTKRERHVVIEEIRMREDQPWTKVYNSANRAMYSSHPYKRDVIGTPQIISQVKRSEIMDYYRTFYSPENMTTIIVGDFNHEEVLSKIEHLFDFSDRINSGRYSYNIDKPVEETKYIENRACINSAFLMFGYLDARANDIKDCILLDMLSIILGEGASSRLYKNLIEKQPEQIFNIIDSEHYIFRDGGNFFVQGNFMPDMKEKAIELVKLEIESVKTTITEEEVQKAKKKIKSRFAANAETVSEIGENIGYYLTVCNDLSLITDYLNIVNKVTVSDIENAAKRYLDINNAVISVLLPE
ncbi:MAG: insulinase family protein [Candidatus Gastranaerophilales bacterium]|nr:insulinase family protein [Candidatus Gastranaerophilales bacterium]